MSKSHVEGAKFYLQQKRSETTLKRIDEYVRKEIDVIKIKLKKHHGCVWIFVEDSLMKYLMREGEEVCGVSHNTLRIRMGDMNIYVTQQNYKWWRVSSIVDEGACFEEPITPEGTVFIFEQKD